MCKLNCPVMVCIFPVKLCRGRVKCGTSWVSPNATRVSSTTSCCLEWPALWGRWARDAAAHSRSSSLEFYDQLLFVLFPDLYLHDGGELRASDLLHRHHHQEVLHHPGFRSSVWERNDLPAVGRHRAGLSRWVSSIGWEECRILFWPGWCRKSILPHFHFQVSDWTLNSAKPPRRRRTKHRQEKKPTDGHPWRLTLSYFPETFCNRLTTRTRHSTRLRFSFCVSSEPS